MPDTQTAAVAFDPDSDPQAWLDSFRQGLDNIGQDSIPSVTTGAGAPGLLGNVAAVQPATLPLAANDAPSASPPPTQAPATGLGPDGADFIKQKEGWHGQGKPSLEGGSNTALWGHKLQPGEDPSKMDPDQTFQADVANAEAKVRRVTQGIPLNQAQFDALTSFAYNTPAAFIPGADNLFMQRLQKGDLQGAADRMPLWNKARQGGTMVALPGLTSRRNAERNLFLNGDYGDQ